VLKPISGGPLGAAGLSQIDPMWRYQVMTERFGPIGTGWKYEIEDVWQTQTDRGKGVINVRILLSYKDGANWSEPIPGVGASPLRDDEAVKGAVTDALSVAMKMLGIGASVYLGHWDGSKYNLPMEKRDVLQQVEGMRDRLIALGHIKNEVDFNDRVMTKFGQNLGRMGLDSLLSVKAVLNQMIKEANAKAN